MTLKMTEAEQLLDASGRGVGLHETVKVLCVENGANQSAMRHTLRGAEADELNISERSVKLYARKWYVAIFFCNAKLGRYRGVADIEHGGE